MLVIKTNFSGSTNRERSHLKILKQTQAHSFVLICCFSAKCAAGQTYRKNMNF